MTKSPESVNSAVESKNKSAEKSQSLKNRFQVIGLAAMILATSTFGVGCGEKATLASEQPTVTEENTGANASEQVPDEEFFDRAKIYPNGTETPEGWIVNDKINYYRGTGNIPEGFCFYELTVEQQAEIKKMEAMSIPEFNALPQTEQLKYSYWLLENYKPQHDMLLQLNNDRRHFTMEPKTAQDLSDNMSYVKSMMECFCTTEFDSQTGEISERKYDIENASKLISMAYLNNGSYQQMAQGALDELGSPYIIKSDIEAFSYSTQDDGTIYVNNAETIMDSRFGSRYLFMPITFTDIHGIERTVYIAAKGEVKDTPQELTNSPNQKDDVTTEIIK